MQYNPLGKTDLRVSRLCLGCMTFGEPDRGNHAWTLPEESSRPIIKTCAGRRHKISLIPPIAIPMAAAKRSSVAHCGDFARREDVVVATKVFHRVW